MLNKLIERYKPLVEGAIPKQNLADPTANSHLLWMLNEIPKFGNTGKAHRWIGYVQGVLTTRGLLDVKTEMDHVRSLIGEHHDKK